ncbi:hypothetical protein FC83_GL001427 [Agrilactobacillus composti DSM 18527 = JCM 14202]|uniref:Surface layer protein A domain-containing protein n=1 Tax=Agrilactobacillus composti DSM 18527 = JCM 14202 TaxID=1423734 RepID=X0PW15_9LACO|nr:hypothetical protein [Agrilactobacillus composti]KRM30866.1 hypothetical protein FC83_GL001427 [Agrilactobacillus composti DSM 18527 = JCM 14202]GAF41741.1 hypothetical protein JCM14202_3699 [Agrilactobacillus composti DSM 18527 = JCM 14202]
MKFKKILGTALLALLFSTVGLLAKPDTTQAAYFRPENQYNVYDSTATVTGYWGANLFSGYDEASHPFLRILPNGSQWRVFGYVKNGDTYWYDLGDNQYVQGSQVRVPVATAGDAILNVAAKYGENPSNDYGWAHMLNGGSDTWYYNGSWGSPYVAVDEAYFPAGATGVIRTREFVVYPNGDAFQVNSFF